MNIIETSAIVAYGRKAESCAQQALYHAATVCLYRAARMVVQKSFLGKLYGMFCYSAPERLRYFFSRSMIVGWLSRVIARMRIMTARYLQRSSATRAGGTLKTILLLACGIAFLSNGIASLLYPSRISLVRALFLTIGILVVGTIFFSRSSLRTLFKSSKIIPPLPREQDTNLKNNRAP